MTQRHSFASLSSEEVQRYASLGGIAAHEQGKAHEFTPETAKTAGKKGAQSLRAKFASQEEYHRHMATLGRKGAEALLAKHGPERMSELGRMGGKLRHGLKEAANG